MPAAFLADLPALSRLALSYAPASVRQEHAALLALDARLSLILRQKREPVLAQMRLAWWRDLFGSPAASWPAGDPLVDALGRWRHPQNLVALVDGWEMLLAEEFTSATADQFAQGRSLAFTALVHQIDLAEVAGRAAMAARIWALADLAANIGDEKEQQIVLTLAKEVQPPPGLPRKLRPLAVLSGLGQAAVTKGKGRPLLAGPASLLTALRVGIVGR